MHDLYNVELPRYSFFGSVKQFLLLLLSSMTALKQVFQIVLRREFLLLGWWSCANSFKSLGKKLKSHSIRGYWGNKFAGQETEAVKETPNVPNPIKQTVCSPFDECLFLTHIQQNTVQLENRSIFLCGPLIGLTWLAFGMRNCCKFDIVTLAQLE